MADNKSFNHEVRQTALITVAIAFALVFGIIVLATGDWLPGVIIVVAALAGLGVQIAAISKLCSGRTAPSPPGSKR
jgi:hypothetical protein